jgi:hypothetical protein
VTESPFPSPHWLANVDWDDPLSYIRCRYNVPAVVGRRVTIWTGERGVIVGGDNGRLLVRVASALDDHPTIILHPTWKIEYGDEVVEHV